jgi:hypothetical protein
MKATTLPVRGPTAPNAESARQLQRWRSHQTAATAIGDAPAQVLSAYRDVTAAQQDQQRAVELAVLIIPTGYL